MCVFFAKREGMDDYTRKDDHKYVGNLKMLSDGGALY
jgi:hypothetical protein